MKTKELLFPIYEFRPLPDDFNSKVYRYNEGKWTPDDGEYDLAFASPNDFVCRYVKLSYRSNILWSWCKDGNWGGYEPKHPNGNAWHYMLREGAKDWGEDWDRDSHPNTIAEESGMDFIHKTKGCANGFSVNFDTNDRHIVAGLVRIKETKDIVKPPKNLVCMYCQPHDDKLENTLTERLCKRNGWEVGDNEDYENAVKDVRWFIKQFERMGYHKDVED